MKNLLTICLVTANRPRTFKKALQSIKDLHFKKFNLIIADDSHDNETEKIVKEFFPQAHYYRNHPPLKEILNSNKAIGMATTELICLFHDDDMFEKDYFDEIIPLMEHDHEIDLAYTGRLMIDEHGNEIAKQIIPNHEEHCLHKAMDILDVMVLGKEYPHYKVEINTPGLVFRKSIFKTMGGFDNKVITHCDTDFLLKILAVSKKVLMINKLLYKSTIWYGYSGRTRSSETGEVFFTEKGVLDNFIKFCQTHSIKKYYDQRELIYKIFVSKCIHLNGPITWINLRFKGSYIHKLEAYKKTVSSMMTIDPWIIIKPKLYIIIILNLVTPRFILNFTHSLFLKLYLKKG